MSYLDITFKYMYFEYVDTFDVINTFNTIQAQLIEQEM